MNNKLGLLAMSAILMVAACNPLVGGYNGGNAYYPPTTAAYNQNYNATGFNTGYGNYGGMTPAIMRGYQPCGQFNLADRPDCANALLTAHNVMNTSMLATNNTMGMMPMQPTVQVLDLQSGSTATPGATPSLTPVTSTNEVAELRQDVRAIGTIVRRLVRRR